MTFLTAEEGQLWLSKYCRHIYGNDFAAAFALNERYESPPDAEGMTILGRALAKLFAHERDSFLWILDWGAWPNLSNMDLFYGYRRSLGEQRLLIDTPFHLFKESDNSKLESLLALNLYFSWDWILGAEGWDAAVSTNNDGFIEVYADEPDELKVLTNILDKLGLPRSDQ